jgi:hypothetical protein
MYKSPCNTCDHRTLGCHDNCHKYQLIRACNLSEKKDILKEKKGFYDAREVHRKSVYHGH